MSQGNPGWESAPGRDPSVVTGEAVALDLRTAALPSRVVAAAIDGAIQLVLFLGLALLVARAMSDSSGAAQQAVSIVGLVLVLIGYHVGLETLMRGRTPGKAAMGLRVVRDDGGPIGFRQALVRGLFAGFLEKPGVLVCIPPVLCSLLNSRNKRLGDLFAGTVVLRERVVARGGVVAQMPPQLAPWAAHLELSRLGDDLALSVRQFVSRAAELTDAAREDLGGRLVRAVLDVTAPPPPPGTPGWAVLAAVLAERRRREELRLAPQGAGAGAGRSGPDAPAYGHGSLSPPGYGPVGTDRQPLAGARPTAVGLPLDGTQPAPAVPPGGPQAVPPHNAPPPGFAPPA